MRVAFKVLKWLIALLVVAVVGAAGWLYFRPPALFEVAAGYSAKIVCSNVFIVGRSAPEVLELDVQAPGHPLLRLMRVSVDEDAKVVTARLLGLFGKGTAVARDGYGCAEVPDGNLAAVMPVPNASTPAEPATGIWPDGATVEPSQDPAITKILDDPTLMGPGMRGVVVVHNGRIIGERYGEGFSMKTPLLGWSMTKSVTAAIIGTLVKAGKLSVDRKDLLDEWKGDGRAAISLADLMAMSSGLEFNEDYGDVTDVTRMLYLEPDMAAFAASKPLTGEIGSVWSYSSGTTNILSSIWQASLGDPAAALAWPKEALFDPIGMTSAVLETDARGTFVGSSYLYATARDWARFGLLMLQDGVWNGEEILPPGFVSWMREPVPASKGEYGRGQVWLHGSDAGTPAGQHPDEGFDLPKDTFWFLGHDGQSIAVVPSKKLVVVRLGLTPSKLGYRAQALVSALVKELD
jgi:CubicO group peptidase (beta-lactamase class C family)